MWHVYISIPCFKLIELQYAISSTISKVVVFIVHNSIIDENLHSQRSTSCHVRYLICSRTRSLIRLLEFIWFVSIKKEIQTMSSKGLSIHVIFEILLHVSILVSCIKSTFHYFLWISTFLNLIFSSGVSNLIIFSSDLMGEETSNTTDITGLEIQICKQQINNFGLNLQIENWEPEGANQSWDS